MKTVRFTAGLLFYLGRAGAFFFLTISMYATAVVLLYNFTGAQWLPITIDDQRFTIFYPFTGKAFFLGEYTTSYLVANLFTLAFYGFFLWLLSDVFRTFKQKRLFTQAGVKRLSRFYLTNLLVPLVFLVLVLMFQNEMTDFIRIMFLHLVIGVFAWFMSAIFKQGLILQQEQDLTF